MSGEQKNDTVITVTNTNTGETKTFTLPHVTILIDQPNEAIAQERPAGDGLVINTLVPAVDLESGNPINLGVVFSKNEPNYVKWRFVGAYEKQGE